MPKFYFSTLVARPMRLGGREFKFLICSIGGGRANGIYEASDPQEIAILDDAVRGRRGVKEIDAAEAELLKKKASTIRQSVNSNGASPPRVIQIPQLLPEQVEVAPGVASHGVRSDGTQRPPLDMPPAPTVSSLVNIASVASPRPIVSSAERARTTPASVGEMKARKPRVKKL